MTAVQRDLSFDAPAPAGRQKRPTQCDRVLQYLREFGEITTLEALRDLGVLHLPRRIADLKERGVRIETSSRKVTTRYGNQTTIAVYRLGARA